MSARAPIQEHQPMSHTDSARRRVGVQFDDAAEFLDELAMDAAANSVERAIVRVVSAYRYSATGAYRQLCVVAGYAEASSGRPVVLEQRVGDDWGDDFPHSAQTRQRADAIATQLRERCGALGLTVRAGRFSDLPALTATEEI
jgi:hypothetical protein